MYFFIILNFNERMKAMNSNNVGIKKWFKFKDIKKNEIPDDKNGYIYIFRLDEKFGRLNGSSDILYIGQCKNLSERLWGNYKKGSGGNTTLRIKDYLNLSKYANAQIGWKSVLNPKDSEKKLLRDY